MGSMRMLKDARLRQLMRHTLKAKAQKQMASMLTRKAKILLQADCIHTQAAAVHMRLVTDLLLMAMNAALLDAAQ